MNSFEHFVKEFLIENEEFKTIEDRYGKILFGEIRKLKEPDTNYEEDQFNDLMNFLSASYGKGLNNDIIKTFKELLKLKKKFPKVLEPPKYKEVYRGFTTTSAGGGSKYKEILKLVEKSLEDPDKLDTYKKIATGHHKDLYFVKLPKNLKYTYKPHSEIQSWSTSSQIAAKFTNIIADTVHRPMINNISCIIAANPSRNEMLFNDRFVNLALTRGSTEDKGEFEVIRISKKPVKCEVYVSYPFMKLMVYEQTDAGKEDREKFDNLLADVLSHEKK